VSSAPPQIDMTSNVTQTNVTEEVILNIPHGRSFQSVIQFAPSARNEPLMGNTVQGGYAGGGQVDLLRAASPMEATMASQWPADRTQRIPTLSKARKRPTLLVAIPTQVFPLTLSRKWTSRTRR